MIIKELNLIGFGKFNNKIIELKDGINLIYGENEGGKTTIHNFIDGMFYGFLRPYARRTLYLEQHEKYNPWNNTKYAGILRFTYNNMDYRIERVFTKGSEDTSILLEDTGEDITQSIDNGDGGRVLQPGFHFFGFNDAVYSNTVSIKQLGSKTEDSLANEVRDKLINVSTSLDDNLSVERALGELDKSLKDIGTIRATTSLYGRIYIDIERLKEERKKILQYRDDYTNLLDKDRKVEEELDFNLKELKTLDHMLKDGLILEKYNIYKEAKSLNDSIVNLEEEAKDLKKYNKLSRDDYDRGKDIHTRLSYLEERAKELKNSLMEADKRLRELDEDGIRQMEIDENIPKDYMDFEKLEERKNKEVYIGDNNAIEFLKRDYEKNISLKNTLNIILIMSIILSLGSIILNIINISNFIWINIISIPVIILVVMRMKNVKKILKGIEIQEEEIKLKEETRLNRISDIEKEQTTILSKYKVDSKLELKRLYDDNHMKVLRDRGRKESYEEIKNKKRDLIKRIQELELEKNNKTLTLKDILEKSGCKDLNQFKSDLEKKIRYNSMIIHIKNKQDLMVEVLGKSTLKILEEEIEKHPKLIEDIKVDSSVEEIKEKMDLKRDQVSDIKIEKKGIEERLNNLGMKVSKLVEIDEEIQRKQKIMEKLENKRASIEMAMDTIGELSKDIHRQFAPTINRRVGEIIQGITNDKYREVRIDDNLDVKVIDPITREIIDINSLSGGTIDQLYFSLRFGIIDAVKNKGLPLILDDCFIQYDDFRLKNMLKFLVDEGKNRQIILFTCHNREREILNSLDIDVNVITLT